MSPRAARTLTVHYVTPTEDGQLPSPAQVARMVACPSSASDPTGDPDQASGSGMRSVTVARERLTVAGTLGVPGRPGRPGSSTTGSLPTPAALWRAAASARAAVAAAAERSGADTTTTSAASGSAGGGPAEEGTWDWQRAASRRPGVEGMLFYPALDTPVPEEVRREHDRARGVTQKAPLIVNGVLRNPAQEAAQTSTPAAPAAPAVPSYLFLPAEPGSAPHNPVTSDAAGPGSRDTLTPMALPDEDDTW